MYWVLDLIALTKADLGSRRLQRESIDCPKK
jgi:hypothetical protein